MLRDMKSGSVYYNMCVNYSHHQNLFSHRLVRNCLGEEAYSYLCNKVSGTLVFLLPRFPVHSNYCPFCSQHLSLISIGNKGLCLLYKPFAVCV